MNLIAIVRAHGERTADECVRLTYEQTEREGAMLRVLNIAPLAEAVRECFRIARRSGRKWLLTVDADVLLAEAAVFRMLRQAVRSDAWQVVGICRDRLSDSKRAVGVRIYKVAALAALLPYVSDDAVRPEGALTWKFGGWEKSKCVAGDHDYHQWYRDYHRKGAQHRQKHPAWEDRAAAWRRSGDLELMAAAEGWYGVPLSIAERGPM